MLVYAIRRVSSVIPWCAYDLGWFVCLFVPMFRPVAVLRFTILEPFMIGFLVLYLSISIERH